MNAERVKTVSSKDGLAIAYDQVGQGPVVILVDAALSTRHDMLPLAGLLVEHFTVINYDRRGRGDSGPVPGTPPQSAQLEVDDIEALIDALGGEAYLFGHSSGAVLALEAANHLPGKVKKAVLYEPPFIVDDSRPPLAADFWPRIGALLQAGKRSDVIEAFMTEAVGVPAEFVGQMKASPMWPEMEKLAHTLPYDGAVMGANQRGQPLAPEKWNQVKARVLVMNGTQSPPWMFHAAQALAKILPGAAYRTLEGQDHGAAVMAPDQIAPVLVDFFYQ